MSAQSSSNRTDRDAKVAENVRAANAYLAEHSHDRQANHALCDLESFDKLIRRGQLATAAGSLSSSLFLGGLKDAAFSGETVDDVRAAIRAYGEWLILVAEKAA
jgi:hypothetical protein